MARARCIPANFNCQSVPGCYSNLHLGLGLCRESQNCNQLPVQLLAKFCHCLYCCMRRKMIQKGIAFQKAFQFGIQQCTVLLECPKELNMSNTAFVSLPTHIQTSLQRQSAWFLKSYFFLCCCYLAYVVLTENAANILSDDVGSQSIIDTVMTPQK